MLLRSVRIENFRALKRARISFEPTTVLIGENDCGRSSVMEAVALALGWNSKEGDFAFQPHHVHHSTLFRHQPCHPFRSRSSSAKALRASGGRTDSSDCVTLCLACSAATGTFRSR